MSRLGQFYDALKQESWMESPEVETNGQETMHGAGECPDSEYDVRAAQPWDGTNASSLASLDRNARVIPHAADPVIVEHYRRLRTKLLREREAHPFQTIMIASPNPNEGKTVTAFNLALSFSMLSSCRVLIIDGDLRKGTVGKWLGAEGQPGISDLIEGSVTLNQVIFSSVNLPMHFMLRGESKMSAAELLNSPALKQYLTELTNYYDLVLVDSPPVNMVADAHLIARCCDAVLMVARAFSTTQKSFEKAVQDLHPVRVLGAVLNGGGPLKRYRRYKGYY